MNLRSQLMEFFLIGENCEHLRSLQNSSSQKPLLITFLAIFHTEKYVYIMHIFGIQKNKRISWRQQYSLIRKIAHFLFFPPLLLYIHSVIIRNFISVFNQFFVVLVHNAAYLQHQVSRRLHANKYTKFLIHIISIQAVYFLFIPSHRQLQEKCRSSY